MLDGDKAKVSESILALPGIADVKGAGDSKISLILDTSIFEGGFSVGHIDPNVMDAIGGEDYEQLESTIMLSKTGYTEVFPFTLHIYRQ